MPYKAPVFEDSWVDLEKDIAHEAALEQLRKSGLSSIQIQDVRSRNGSAILDCIWSESPTPKDAFRRALAIYAYLTQVPPVKVWLLSTAGLASIVWLTWSEERTKTAISTEIYRYFETQRGRVRLASKAIPWGDTSFDDLSPSRPSGYTSTNDRVLDLWVHAIQLYFDGKHIENIPWLENIQKQNRETLQEVESLIDQSRTSINREHLQGMLGNTRYSRLPEFLGFYDVHEVV